MTFEKLTYSGRECNNYLYFSLNSDFFDPEVITKRLGIQPTSIMIKQNPIPKSTSWDFEIQVGNELDLETPLEKLITIFEPHIEEINQLKSELNLESRIQFVIDIDINPEASTPCLGLNKRTIDFLWKTQSEVEYDIYKADTIGLLGNE